MFGTMALALASGTARAQDPALDAFLDWHCSPQNVLRYAGPLELAPLPAPGVGEPVGSRVLDRGVEQVAEIGPDGLGGSLREADTFPEVAIDHRAPMSTVASALSTLSSQHPEIGAWWVLFRVDEPGTPRPPVPLSGPDLARFEQLAQSPDGAAPPPAEAFGSCTASALSRPGLTCSSDVDLIRRGASCGADLPRVLAWFTVASGGTARGVPVRPVRVRREGEPAIAGEATWGDAAPRLFTPGAEPAIAAPPPKPEPERAADGVWDVPYRYLTVKKRVEAAHPPGMVPGDKFVCDAVVTVDTRGRVVGVDASACAERVRAETRAALLQWRFAPFERDGQPVQFRVVARIIFVKH